MWCTTSSGNVEVEVEVDLLSLPTYLSRSLPHTHARTLLRLLQLLGLNGLGGMGPGAWAGLECGGQGGRAARIRVSQRLWWLWFPGVRLGLGGWAPASRRTTGTGKAQPQGRAQAHLIEKVR